MSKNSEDDELAKRIKTVSSNGPAIDMAFSEADEEKEKVNHPKRAATDLRQTRRATNACDVDQPAHDRASPGSSMPQSKTAPKSLLESSDEKD